MKRRTFRTAGAAAALIILTTAGVSHAGNCSSSSTETKAAVVKAGVMKAGKSEKTKDGAAGDIVETAVAAGSFKTLVAAVQAAGLVDVLKGEGPFTVFAPTDEAFAKLPKGTLENLLKPENKAALQGILTYHVVPGTVLAGDVVKLKAATTAQGSDLKIRARDGVVTVDKATVKATDIRTSNGVIHVIDTVLIPETPKTSE